jgi:hypothetical protein
MPNKRTKQTKQETVLDSDNYWEQKAEDEDEKNGARYVGKPAQKLYSAMAYSTGTQHVYRQLQSKAVCSTHRGNTRLKSFFRSKPNLKKWLFIEYCSYAGQHLQYIICSNFTGEKAENQRVGVAFLKSHSLGMNSHLSYCLSLCSACIDFVGVFSWKEGGNLQQDFLIKVVEFSFQGWVRFWNVVIRQLSWDGMAKVNESRVCLKANY